MKYLVPSLVLSFAAAGIAVWIFADYLLLGLGMIAIALVLWALAPAVLGRPGGWVGSAKNADPQRIKEFRSKNPGATIADGIRATRP